MIGGDSEWSRDFFRAGTFVFVGGAIVSVFAALTGFWDWWKSSEKGTQARRTINAHASAMILVTVLVLTDIGFRLSDYDRTSPSAGVWALSVLIALLVSVGAVYSGAMVYEYGFNVETAGDHPVWHQSETDVFHGEH